MVNGDTSIVGWFMMRISNSEVNTYLECKRKHYYSYVLGLKSVNAGFALNHGNIGHDVWAFYYKTWSETNKDNAEDVAVARLLELSIEYKKKEYVKGTKAINMVMRRFDEYTKFYAKERFKVLGVEETFVVKIPGGNDFAFTVDLLIEYTSGPYKGEVVPLDFKWCWNFWTDWEKKMHPQFPKYIWGLQQLGFPSKMGMLDQIRYRPDAKPDKIFERYPIIPSQAMIDKVMEEHFETAAEVQEALTMPVAYYGTIARRTMDKDKCGYCAFTSPCYEELNGNDASYTLASNYKDNDYGYRRG